jgi:hypothetical protein
MSENTFDPQEINLQFQPLPAFIDPDGSFKLNTPMLSSFNFDGSIPKFDGNIDAIDVKPGYLIQIEAGGQYYPVVSVEFDDPAIENTDLVTINYIDESGNTVSEEYGETDQVAVVYEDWSQKILGSQGWGITAEGNAIFTNVAVRGRIEATEGEISGNLIVNGGLLTSLTASTTGGLVLNNSGLTAYNTSGTQTFNINANTGTVTIGGYATDSDISGLIEGSEVNSYVTSISGNSITSGSFTGLVFRTALPGAAVDRIQILPQGRIEWYDSTNYRTAYSNAVRYSQGATTYTGMSIGTDGGSIISLESISSGINTFYIGDIDPETNAISTSTNLVVGGDASVGTNVSSKNLLVYGKITTASVVASVFYGNGSQLTNIAAGNAYKNGITDPTPANKITFGTGDPPGSGRTTGDIHLRYT